MKLWKYRVWGIGRRHVRHLCKDLYFSFLLSKRWWEGGLGTYRSRLFSVYPLGQNKTMHDMPAPLKP